MEENERKAECKKHIEGLRLRTCPQKQNGITLIALIITIIVMLILVEVTINVVLNGGLFTQAQEAAKNTQKEAEREELLSAVAASYEIETKTVNKEKLKSNLGEDWTVEGEGPYTVTSPKENVFIVDKNGTIDPPPTSPYEYTLAEIIEKAQNSSVAIYYDERENENYEEGTSYEIGMVIPFSEFWKEGTPDNIKNGTESTYSGIDYEYIVTVENFPYIEMSENLDYDDLDRGLIFAGVSAETAQEDMGIETTENCIYVLARELTSKDDPKQIKIKIGAVEPEPEPPEPEFNGFTLGDLVDAATVNVDTENEKRAYFDIPIANFNSIIGQDIKTLDEYICAKDLVISDEDSKYDFNGYIRVKGTSADTYIYDMSNSVISGFLSLKGCKEEEIAKTDEQLKWLFENKENAEAPDARISLTLLKNKETEKEIVRLSVFESGDYMYHNKSEIPEKALNSELKFVNSKKVNELLNEYGI